MSWSGRKCGFTTFAVFLVLMLVLLCLQHETVGQWQKNKENMMSSWTLSNVEGTVPPPTRSSPRTPPVVDAGSGHPFAFVTSVYDDATCDATQVMLYSLVMTQSVAQLVVLTLKDQLGQECTDALRTLGALVKEVDPIASPSGKSTQLYNQHLRFTKLLVWGMVEYQKVILIDSDMVVLKNIDHLFDRSDLSAVEDPGAPGMFNSGLMVISPSATLLAEMLEALPNAETYNGGDQGFLNSFFESKWTENLATLRLPAIYNAFPRMKRYASWKVYAEDIHVIHFTAEVKPWNFYSKHHPNWRYEFDSELAWLWTERKIKKDLWLKERTESMGEVAVSNDEMSQCRQWSKLQGRRRDSKKFTLMINTFDDKEAVAILVKHYLPTPSLAAIHIIWHDPLHDAPSKDFNYGPPYNNRGIPIHVTQAKTNTLNNRWNNPFPAVATELVLTLDDDIIIEDLKDVELAFQVAKQHPMQLVGMFPRSHHVDLDNGALSYIVSEPRGDDGFKPYSMMLTKLLFVNFQYLYMYSCLLPYQVRSYVTSLMNCEDLAMNWMVAGLTAEPPLAVTPFRRIFDMGTFSNSTPDRISLQPGHRDTRNDCLTYFFNQWGQKVPLIYSGLAAQHFLGVTLEKTTKKEWLEKSENRARNRKKREEERETEEDEEEEKEQYAGKATEPGEYRGGRVDEGVFGGE